MTELRAPARAREATRPTAHIRAATSARLASLFSPISPVLLVLAGTSVVPELSAAMWPGRQLPWRKCQPRRRRGRRRRGPQMLRTQPRAALAGRCRVRAVGTLNGRLNSASTLVPSTDAASPRTHPTRRRCETALARAARAAFIGIVETVRSHSGRDLEIRPRFHPRAKPTRVTRAPTRRFHRDESATKWEVPTSADTEIQKCMC